MCASFRDYFEHRLVHFNVFCASHQPVGFLTTKAGPLAKVIYTSANHIIAVLEAVGHRMFSPIVMVVRVQGPAMRLVCGRGLTETGIVSTSIVLSLLHLPDHTHHINCKQCFRNYR